MNIKTIKTVFKGVTSVCTLVVGVIDVYNFSRNHICPSIKNRFTTESSEAEEADQDTDNDNSDEEN